MTARERILNSVDFELRATIDQCLEEIEVAAWKRGIEESKVILEKAIDSEPIQNGFKESLLASELIGWKRGMEEAAKIADSHDFTLDKDRRVANFIRAAIEKKL